MQSNGLQTSQATTTAWIVASSPVFISILAWLVLKEKLSFIQIVGIVLAMLGVLVVVSKGEFASIALGSFGTFGDFLILISAVNWAVFSILSRRAFQTHPSTRLTFWVMTLGWLITTIAFVAGKNYTEVALLDSRGWWAMIFLGIFTTGLAYIAWFDVLSQLPAAQSSAFLFLEPPASMIVAAIVLFEKITWASIFGGIVIILGVWLVNKK